MQRRGDVKRRKGRKKDRTGGQEGIKQERKPVNKKKKKCSQEPGEKSLGSYWGEKRQ